MERILRISILLAVLFVAQGWSRPNKDPSYDYADDEYAQEDYSQTDEDSESSRNDVDPPKIKSKPVARRVQPGDTIILPCDVENVDPYSIIWKRNVELLYSDHIPLTNEPNRIIKLANNSLMILNATANDTSDNYICQLSTEPVTEIVHRVLVEPEIIVTPSNRVEINYGQDVVLGCKSSLQPNADIKWSRKGKRLPIGHETVQGGSITIYKATRHQAGLYQCLIDNHTKMPLHTAIELVVNYPPEIEVEQESVHTGTGTDSELACIVHAHPRAHVIWFKNKKPVTPKENKILMKNVNLTHILILKHTTKHDLGLYTCQASNSMGTSSQNISLTGVPTKATFAGGEVGNDDNTLILKWRLQSYSPITEYKLQYRRKGENSWIEMTPRVTDGQGADGTIYTVEHPLKGLESGKYEATLAARNTYGWSPKSELFTFNGEYVPVEEPTRVTGSAVTSKPLLALTTLLLVVTSYISTNL